MAKKMSDAEQVSAYMAALDHPMKAEIEALREVIKAANARIAERIKWNAPSYFSGEDIVTFGPPARKTDEIMLVFHHPAVVKIDSPILQGKYPDRRLAIFKNMAEIEANRTEIARVLNEIIAAMSG